MSRVNWKLEVKAQSPHPKELQDHISFQNIRKFLVSNPDGRINEFCSFRKEKGSNIYLFAVKLLIKDRISFFEAIKGECSDITGFMGKINSLEGFFGEKEEFNLFELFHENSCAEALDHFTYSRLYREPFGDDSLTHIFHDANRTKDYMLVQHLMKNYAKFRKFQQIIKITSQHGATPTSITGQLDQKLDPQKRSYEEVNFFDDVVEGNARLRRPTTRRRRTNRRITD